MHIEVFSVFGFIVVASHIMHIEVVSVSFSTESAIPCIMFAYSLVGKNLSKPHWLLLVILG